MDIDDSSEKVRRNLLVFSFIIVVSSFLNLSIQKEGKIFSAIDLNAVSPFKFWLVVTVVLTFLFYRYWFDANTSSAIQQLQAEWNSYRYGFMKKLLNNDIEKAFLKNRKPLFLPNFDGLMNSHYSLNTKELGLPIRAQSLAGHSYGNSPWEGTIGNSFSITWKGNVPYAMSGGLNSNYTITGHSKYYLKCKTLLKLFLYSKSIGEFITPISLSFSAMLVCAYQLGFTYFQVIDRGSC